MRDVLPLEVVVTPPRLLGHVESRL
jgi:hypothetical protein